MTHYSGINLAVGWGGTAITAVDLAGHGRTVDVSETAPAPDTIDVTHKGDTSKQIIEGLPGAPETNITFTAIVDDTWSVNDTMIINTLGTLYVWPRGKIHAYPQIIIRSAVLHERSYKAAYDGTIETTLVFNAKTTATHGTYASA